MSKRVSPTERVRAETDALFASERDLASILEDVAWLTVRLMMQTAIEAGVDEFLGRGRYERRHDEDRPGSRNGRQPPTAVKTTMGPVELHRPRLSHSSGWGWPAGMQFTAWRSAPTAAGWLPAPLATGGLVGVTPTSQR